MPPTDLTICGSLFPPDIEPQISRVTIEDPARRDPELEIAPISRIRALA